MKNISVIFCIVCFVYGILGLSSEKSKTSRREGVEGNLRQSLNKMFCKYYRKTSNIRRTLVSNKIVDHSDVVGASPVGAAPTTSSFST